ncbi:hypothetical protein [Burkholderia gladioli]|nr:hypothetical protein [Burkholderia gladioli]MDA0569854.1 hypothetical protein [Burkholderia gladioli]MDA0598326.1 hypothetical protein [Burkholderia gladioli]
MRIEVAAAGGEHQRGLAEAFAYEHVEQAMALEAPEGREAVLLARA